MAGMKMPDPLFADQFYELCRDLFGEKVARDALLAQGTYSLDEEWLMLQKDYDYTPTLHVAPSAFELVCQAQAHRTRRKRVIFWLLFAIATAVSLWASL
jgi:hypothetical protein